MARVGSTGAMCVALVLALAGCSHDPSAPPSPPLALDLSGVWAGTWSGSNETNGYVTGTWEASVTQTSNGMTGTMVLGGDGRFFNGEAAQIILRMMAASGVARPSRTYPWA